jgi:hypothetical protein
MSGCRCAARFAMPAQIDDLGRHTDCALARYDKGADNFLAGVKLASARIWMRFDEVMAQGAGNYSIPKSSREVGRTVRLTG